jgi:hypothetical protein
MQITTRVSRGRLLSLAAVMLVMLLTVACGGGASPAPTPDPFTGLADRSDQAFREGLEDYGQGHYRDALDAFQRAQVLSPNADPRIAQMIERTRQAMEPTPTPVPPTATPEPVAPTPTPAAMSTATPDGDLGQRYFGGVVLAIVPAKSGAPVAADQFFYQDQLGLWIEGLDKHLRLPFTLRVFNVDTKQLVADVASDAPDPTTPTPSARATAISTSKTSRGTTASVAPTATIATTTTAADATATPGALAPTDYRLARFWDNYVWYHTGDDQPGKYRLELYANGTLTNTFDYTVGTLPIAAATPTPEPMLDEMPTPTIVVATGALAEPTPVPTARPARPSPAAASGGAPTRPEPTATLQPTATAQPTATPTPGKAYTTVTGGLPAGLDVDSRNGRFYIADASGVVWSTDAPEGAQKSTLGAPLNVAPAIPRDLAVDQTSGNLFVAARGGAQGGCATQAAPAAQFCVLVLDGTTGAKRTVIALDGEPANVRIDSDLGLLYLSVPSQQAVEVADIRSGRVMNNRTLRDMPQVTSLAIDPSRHLLYAAHLGGQVTVINTSTSRILARPSVTGAGLSSVAAARGLAYAVNTATHELAVLDPTSGNVDRFLVSQEPAAVAASEDNGAVYVLSSRASQLLRIDPTDGTEIGRVLLPDRSGHVGLAPGDNLSMRPRLALNPADETVFATLPESGALAAVADDQFPVMAREIPAPDQDTSVLVAGDIPSVMRPAPNQFGTALAQAPGAH